MEMVNNKKTTEVNVKCPYCGKEFTEEVTVEIEPSERDEM